MSSLTLRIHDRIADVPQRAWDALLDPAAGPFVSFAFLDALERSGCAAPERGWRPRHLGLWRGGTLVAAAPAYAKDDHGGDFARDWVWAEAVRRAGVPYYPRLLVTVPITPVTGRRILVAPGESRAAALAALVDGAKVLAREERMSSVHVLYALPEEAAELAAAGMIARVDVQGHWQNHDYKDWDDYLWRGLNAKHRRQVKIERDALAGQGITVRTVRGEAIAAAREKYGEEAWGFYRATTAHFRGPWAWLNRGFFHRVFATMPGPLELVEAWRDGRLVAGAFNMQHGERLYGRYWGAHEPHEHLHFNVCYHHSIEDCIRRGLQVFEGGAGGEHKLHRGFDLSLTHSAHWFAESRIHTIIRQYLERERTERAVEVEAWHHRRKKKP
ncbi:MAG TPA: GNAT family N-acetyltransferase [Haliangiales bacterium]|nr:GNAT family N-acetyltransferase [Haliangiales bacterium]